MDLENITIKNIERTYTSNYKMGQCYNELWDI